MTATELETYGIGRWSAQVNADDGALRPPRGVSATNRFILKILAAFVDYIETDGSSPTEALRWWHKYITEEDVRKSD